MADTSVKSVERPSDPPGMMLKKRASSPENVLHVPGGDNNMMMIQEPCCKKAKGNHDDETSMTVTSKKELLEKAKARLKEAQERKKLLQQKLEEEKANVTTTDHQGPMEPLEMYEDDGYDDHDFYYEYEYEYQIPPVTGSKESLLITQIESTGPPDKVRFVQDTLFCIENVIRVITERRSLSSLSPIHPASASTNNTGNAMASIATAPWNPNNANPQGPPLPPPGPQNEATSEGTNSVTSTTTATTTTKTATFTLNRPPALDGELKSQRPNPRFNNQPPSRNTNGDRFNPTHPQSSRLQGSAATNSNHASNRMPSESLKSKPNSTPPTPSDNPRRGNNNSSGPPFLHSTSNGTGRAPPPPPPPPSSLPLNNSKRPWKFALAQITAKALDCSVDLPTSSPYLIRTQDQGVVAHVQFFSSPPNPALLEHHPSKRHLQDHFVPMARLPSNSSQSWNGQEILAFLKNQDEATVGGRKTYQPPARRNLPCTHWALLECLEQPLLQAVDFSQGGYFTAAPAASNKSNSSSSSSNNNNNNNTGNDTQQVSFAGKLVWNMNDFYQQQLVGDRHGRAAGGVAKISKWGEVVSVVATSGIRNSPLIATIQGFYELATTPSSSGASGGAAGLAQPMPPALRARKVLLSQSRTIGIIIGANPRASDTDKNTNNQSPQMGCCQVLFPNGMASGPASAQALKGARAILYD